MPVVWDVQKVVQINVQTSAHLGVPDALLIAVVIVVEDAILVVLEDAKQELKQDLHVLEHHVKVDVKVIAQVDVRDALQFVEAVVVHIAWIIAWGVAVITA